MENKVKVTLLGPTAMLGWHYINRLSMIIPMLCRQIQTTCITYTIEGSAFKNFMSIKKL